LNWKMMSTLLPSHCTPYEQGCIHSCTLSSTQMGKVCGLCWWSHWVEDVTCKHSGISSGGLLSCTLLLQ
jgi:hypothetical protein